MLFLFLVVGIVSRHFINQNRDITTCDYVSEFQVQKEKTTTRSEDEFSFLIKERKKNNNGTISFSKRLRNL